MIESKIQDALAETERCEDQKVNSLELQLKNLLGSSDPDSSLNADLPTAVADLPCNSSEDGFPESKGTETLVEDAFGRDAEETAGGLTELLPCSSEVVEAVELAVDNLEQAFGSVLAIGDGDVQEYEQESSSESVDFPAASLLAVEAALLGTPREAEVAEEVLESVSKLGNDMGNIALDEDELETLQDLVVRYDQVVSDLDDLNKQIERLLASEGIQGCES